MTSKIITFTRIEHFKNILEDIQGKTPIYFSDEFINDIKNKLKNKEITSYTVKEILKNKKLHKYYEFIPAILKKLNVRVVEFTEEEEETLCELFKEVLKVHTILYPNQCFLPHYYILYRLVEYIKYNKLHLLKLNNYNRKIYDEKWELICQELDWIFVN